MGRTTLTGDDDVVDDLLSHKRDDENTTDLLERAERALSDQPPESDAVDVDALADELRERGFLTEDHIDDIASRTSSTTTRELESTLRR